jgi:hypothetical protein
MKIKKISGKINGTLFLDKIGFDRIETAEIRENNKTSGRVTFPVNEVGQTVYILYPKKEANKNA